MRAIFYFTKRIYSFAGNVLFFNFFGMILVSILESVGILLLIPLLSISGIMDVGSKEVFFLSWINDLFQGIHATLGLSIILTIYVFIIIGQSLFQRHQTIINKKIQQGFIRQLREETYKAILHSNWNFFLRNRKTDIIKVLTGEIAYVKSGTMMFLTLISSILFTIIQIGIAFFLSAKMTLFVLSFGITLLFLSRHFVKKSNEFGRDNNHLSKIYLANITDHLNGIKEIKSNTLEVSHINWFQSFCKEAEHNSVEFTKLTTNSQLIYKVVSAFLIALFVFISIKMFQSKPAQLIVIVVIFSRLWPSIARIQSKLEKLSSMIPSFEALANMQDQCKELEELRDDDFGKVHPIILKEGLKYQNVYFRYNKDENSFTLKDINLEIPANKMSVIVGPSGAGKSTLIDLLMGLNQAELGEILIDGIPLCKGNLLPLRRSISYVPQDPFLFNASIRENLLLIEPQSTEDHLWEALRFVSAAEFVNKLPEGLDTLIGDRGVRLSGGERQRLVLARAILRNPSILILDEATSALDSENEARIQEALERLKGKMTIIVIAHRLSTIRNADQVVVLDEGKIIQIGKYSELASEKRGMFSRLLDRQLESIH